jgi:hypothetical protein
MLNSDLLKASVSLLVASSPASAAERLDAPKLESRRARNRFRTCTQTYKQHVGRSLSSTLYLQSR